MNTSIERFTTPRLLAERISLDHFEEIHRLHRDPKVIKTLSADGNVLPDEQTREGLERQVGHWEQCGFGLWVFRTRAGEFVGRGGIQQYQIDAKTEVGLAYAVGSEFWNQGLATEMAHASLRIGFERLGFAEIASWTLPVNTASQRVLLKLGFQYERDFQFAGLPHRLYRLTASGWKPERVCNV